MKKGQLSSPMADTPATPSATSAQSGTFDRHTAPEFSKPHDVDANTIRVKMFEDMPVNLNSKNESPANGDK